MPYRGATLLILLLILKLFFFLLILLISKKKKDMQKVHIKYKFYGEQLHVTVVLK